MKKPAPSQPKLTTFDLCHKLHDALYIAASRASSALMPAKDGEILMHQFNLSFEILKEITERVK